MSPSEKKSSPYLRILVFGAGAIGTYIGVSMATHGHKVIFTERPEVAQELSERGMRLKIGSVEHRVAQPGLAISIAQALEAGPFDVAVIALKAYDTHAMLETMTPFVSQLPPILCLQNGVENEAAIASLVGEEKVIPGTVTSAVGRIAAGDVVLEKQRGIGVAAGHPVTPALVSAMNQAGMNARIFRNAASMKWSKLLTNLLANASSAILDMTPGEIFSNPDLYKLELAQLRETLAVMKALGVKVTDLPGTPVRLLAFGAQLPYPNLSRPFMQRSISGGRGNKMPSFHIDLHLGKKISEVDYLNGAVVRFSNRLGVPTPVNHLLNETLLSLVEGRLPLEQFRRHPEELIHSTRP